MALSILDGTQTATTLSTILSGGQHITAHTVVSLGTQAKTDILSAVSSGIAISGSVTANVPFASTTATYPSQIVALGFQDTINTGNILPVGNDANGLPIKIDTIRVQGAPETYLPVWLDGNNNNDVPISGTVTANGGDFSSLNINQPASKIQVGFQTIGGDFVATNEDGYPFPVNLFVDGTRVENANPLPISGTVTANLAPQARGPIVEIDSAIPADPKYMAVVGGVYSNEYRSLQLGGNGEIIVSSLPAGTNRIGVVTIGAGTVTIGAGTAQIGSVTASISGTIPISISSVTISNFPATQPISISSVTIGNSVTIANFPATQPISIASVTIGNTVTISGTVTANTFAIQGTSVTTSNFTSLTPSTVLANFNATREVLTIFNEGAGNLHVCAGATCTTIAYQVRLSAGDYYEVPNHQTTITHSAVFATAGTARVTQVS